MWYDVTIKDYINGPNIKYFKESQEMGIKWGRILSCAFPVIF